jgi:hypothetical protein
VKVHSALFKCCGELPLSKLEEASMRYGAFGMRVLVLLGVMASKRFELVLRRRAEPLHRSHGVLTGEVATVNMQLS